MAFDAPVTEITAAEQTVLCRRFGFSAHIRLLPSLLCPLGMTAC